MIEIIITSSVLILALILFRKLCWGKISRRLQYGLWLLVIIRLLVPAQFFTSSLSIMNIVEYAGEAAYTQWQTVHNEGESTKMPDATQIAGDVQADNRMPNDENLKVGIEGVNNSQRIDDISDENSIQSSTGIPRKTDMPDTSSVPSMTNQGEIFWGLLLGIYIVGIFLIGGCIILCNLKFHRLLVADRQLIGREGRLNVYLTSHINSPCLCGICVPAIYMTKNALWSQERKDHILLHEMTHYRHLDHIWAVVRSLCLALYWFHPLVWIAAKLSAEDSELACDEGTLVRLGEEKREAYGRTLIEMMTDQAKTSRLLYCATGIINGKEEIKKRITAIAFYKKQMFWIAALVVVFAVLLSACTAGTVEQDTPDGKTVQENTTGEDETTDEAETNGEDETTGANNDSRQNNSSDQANASGKGDEENQESSSGSSDMQEPQLQLASDVVMNSDGSFRLAEYEVDLTGDKVKDRIVFDVLYWTELGSDNDIVTKRILWNKLWDGSEVSVKVLEGKEAQNTDAEETILEEYSFSSAHAGNGNLAVVRYEGQMCIMLYSNLMYQGGGGFGYEIWKIMPFGTEPVLLEEMTAAYMAPGNGDNTQETIDQVIQVGNKLDSYLSGSNTTILINASSDSEECYLYGSESGLLNGVRRQNAFGVFMAEVGGDGTELKLADYFYPEGMEPLTKLPEDAETRILNGEIMYMEVSRDNSTAGKLDLNGDGEKEVLYLEAVGSYFNDDGWSKWDYIDSDFRVRVNNLYYESYCSIVDPVLMAFSPDGEQILLAVYDDGPSGDPVTSFFRYDDTGVYPAGKLPDDLRDATIDADGVIKCTFRADMLQTEWARGYYYWNGSEIVRREDDIYYFVDDSKWREENQIPLVLLKEITVFEERSESSQAITMKPQKVRNVASDQSEWILLEAEDGTRGWIRLVQFCFPSEESDPFELFEGLNMAD